MENITLFSLFIIGLSYGATACMFSCMPFLAPLLISNSTNYSSSFKIVLPFSLGRIITYTMIALVASSSSVLIKSILDDNALFQTLLGSFTIVMAIGLLYTTFNDQTACKSSIDHSSKPKGMLGIFTIGALVSLNPCVPVLTLITLSANTTSASTALAFGLLFGLGAVLIPFIFYTLIVGTVFKGLIEQFKTYTKYIQLFAALLLLFVGVMVLAGKISL